MLAYTNLVIFAKYFFQFPLFCTYRSASGTVFDAGLSCLSNQNVEVRKNECCGSSVLSCVRCRNRLMWVHSTLTVSSMCLQDFDVSWPYLTGIDKHSIFIEAILADLFLLTMLLVHRWTLRWKACISFQNWGFHSSFLFIGDVVVVLMESLCSCGLDCRGCGQTRAPANRMHSSKWKSRRKGKGIALSLRASLLIVPSCCLAVSLCSLIGSLREYFLTVLSQHDGRDYYVGIFFADFVALLILMFGYSALSGNPLDQFLSVRPTSFPCSNPHMLVVGG